MRQFSAQNPNNDDWQNHLVNDNKDSYDATQQLVLDIYDLGHIKYKFNLEMLLKCYY